jgi:hypothetical protein
LGSSSMIQCPSPEPPSSTSFAAKRITAAIVAERFFAAQR